MNQYQITTAQNVSIHLTIANMGDRILAGLIDVFILIGYLLLAYFICTHLDPNIDGAFSHWVYFIFTLPVYFYSLLFEFFMDGQTPGKRLRRLTVVRMDGESLTFGNCLMRWLFRLVDIWFDYGSVGIVTATFSGIHQRIGDMVAGTIVISHAGNSDMDIATYAEPDPNGSIYFPEVERLKLRDIQVVNEALALYYERDKFDYVLLVSAQLKKAMDISTDLDDLSFVKRVVTDYNQIHQTQMVR